MMYRIARTLMLAVVTLVACAALTPRAPRDGWVTVLADNSSQAVFNDAIKWSRKYGLETGGCFQVYSQAGKFIVIVDAIETVMWRRPMRVLMNCPVTAGTWHTHWLPESTTMSGCNAQLSQDLWLIGTDRPFGIIICGVGRDSVIPYTYDATNKPARDTTPEAIARQRADTFYRCVDEPRVSLLRPLHYCTRDTLTTTRKAS